MSFDNRQLIQCVQCGRNVYVSINEATHKGIDMKVGILCWTCCKKQYWGKANCNACSDKIMCTGEFTDKMKEWLENRKGV
jgi:hypothetical protein